MAYRILHIAVEMDDTIIDKDPLAERILNDLTKETNEYPGCKVYRAWHTDNSSLSDNRA